MVLGSCLRKCCGLGTELSWSSQETQGCFQGPWSMCGLWLSLGGLGTVGRHGSSPRQGKASLKIWPGAPGTRERLVAWPGPAVLGGRQCLVLGRSQGDGSQFLVQAAMPG